MSKRVRDRKMNVLRARDYRFGPEEIRLFRILGVYNSVSRVNDMDEGYVRRFIESHFISDYGEIALSEKAFFNEYGEEMCILSVVIFADLFAMQLYVIKFKDVYLEGVKDRSLMGKFN